MPLILSAFFLIQLKMVQHRAKEKLENNRLHTIVLDKKEFNWYKKNKEISIDGKLFDVKSYSEADGKHVFTGIYDHEETALNNLLQTHTNKEKNQYLAGVFQLLFSSHSSHFPEITSLIINSANNFPLTVTGISSPAKDILTPPPQFVITYCL
jgi:hypothetical protein